VDRSLWLLLRLRTFAWARRWGRNLRSLKGLLLAVVGSLVFVPMIATAVLGHLARVQIGAQTSAIHRYGPLGLCFYCFLQVLLSAGDRAIYYSPAEVNFLFSGPFRPRQLLLYKVGAGIGAGLMMTPFLSLAFSPHAESMGSAVVGVFLSLEFLYLFSLSLSLLISTVGAYAFDRARRLLLIAVGAVAVTILTPLCREMRREGLSVWVDQLLKIPAVHVLLWPFKPFVMAFTARWLSADLAVWSAVALAIDLALIGLVLVLNDQFLEASAATSAKLYARIQRARRGEGWVAGKPIARFSLPMLPWWGGVGPNLWRQLTTASRSTSKLIGMFVMFGFPLLTILLVDSKGVDDPNFAAPAISVIVSIALFAPSLVGFDFRPDLGRMEDLKTLPLRPSCLALGQVVTPVLILTLTEWVALGAVAVLAPNYPMLLLGAAAMALPLNLMLVAIENLYFLWYPFRMTGFNAFDFQAMGRQMLLMAAKMVTVGVAATIALGAGALLYYLAGQSWLAAIATAWVVVAGLGLALVPILGHAFLQFDVSESQAE
jgi:Putative ABC exporter